MTITTKVCTSRFPLYSDVRTLMPIWVGVEKAALIRLRSALVNLQGTPQNPVKWTDPDNWIRERLQGEAAELAESIWLKSNKTFNPRYIYGSHIFIIAFELLTPNRDGYYKMTERGQAFVDDDPSVVREIDEAEGIPELLAILKTHTPAKRSDLLKEWAAFLQDHPKRAAPATVKDTLRRRLLNLVERGFVERTGNVYMLTKKGLAYAAPVTQSDKGDPSPSVL